MSKTFFDHQAYFSSQLDHLKEEGRYRVFAELERKAGDFPHAKQHVNGEVRDVTIWCANDYLGMGQHPKVIAAMHEADYVGTHWIGTFIVDYLVSAGRRADRDRNQRLHSH